MLIVSIVSNIIIRKKRTFLEDNLKETEIKPNKFLIIIINLMI